ncbi:MAG: type II toxin-antitoxin system HicA family toxin [Halothece sp.]
MSNDPSVTAKDVIKVLKQLNFYLDRQKGSHAIYKNIQGRRVVLPIHSGKNIKKGTLLGIIQDIGIDKARFFELLQK